LKSFVVAVVGVDDEAIDYECPTKRWGLSRIGEASLIEKIQKKSRMGRCDTAGKQMKFDNERKWKGERWKAAEDRLGWRG
jgi:hypothetical protein